MEKDPNDNKILNNNNNFKEEKCEEIENYLPSKEEWYKNYNNNINFRNNINMNEESNIYKNNKGENIQTFFSKIKTIQPQIKNFYIVWNSRNKIIILNFLISYIVINE